MTTERIVTPIYYTPAEVAKLLRCSRQAIRRMVERGDLPVVRRPAGQATRYLIPAKAIADLLGKAGA